MALVLMAAPSADVVFGSAQRFRVPMGYGGPHHRGFPRCSGQHSVEHGDANA